MSLIKLQNYAGGQWIPATDNGETLYNAITGEALYTADSKNLDFAAMMQYARTTGSPALRKMTFHERGRMLKALALYLMERKETYYTISAFTGATRADSWVDIEGGIGNLFANASLRRQFPDEPFYIDGDVAPLSKGGSFIGHHIMVPKRGVAIHINAFNFPVWGMLEKVAVNLMAGVPAIVKPATLTSFLTEAVVQDIIASGILPAGALQLICGSARGILDFVENGDTVTFTGSATTGKMLKSHPRLIEEAVPFNMEADSLNCSVLGIDVTTDMPEFDIFIKEIAREITTKAGQKCTAVRRIIVPENMVEDVQIALGKRLASSTIGDPSVEGVRMGSLAGQSQKEEVLGKIKELQQSQEIVIGDLDAFEVKGADKEKGAFLPPVVFFNDNPFQKTDVHNIEAFGPVSTIMPYKTTDEAAALAQMGKGSLVSSIITADDAIAKDYTLEAATMHGRILILNRDCAKESTGHGSPMPMLVHGGPGRAGGGEEMGGIRGVLHYMQRTAIQGSPTTITAITNVYQQGAKGNLSAVHPFKKYFEELKVSDQLMTESREITSEDIDKFAALSGDNFYAHKVETDFEGTMFDQQVAHGYFIMSIAAGLFVDSYELNPVLLNYGIDDLRFTKPVYPGAKISIRFTCKQKLPNDTTPSEDNPKSKIKRGIVKWLVEMLDDTDEPLVGVATILTMVKLKNQD
ncbi:phenylacetic acid degradation bifunctional protein PaaZ [Taibaiella sp. KBW10]|uniref:phenylacetic acid degradation bifunctional protein PaaZ n=1 Tax=Taibaiella sp. KBW10 TaxID=2153357 RepID=UPI000F5A4AA0|nr:phenylacetic acid degradation bifunctional protein PaaZ [Taibaiella sp. KBW10]RQO32071.1 phenylacetic acid degradation bifunctional protein PaaZ [Taibaiella sp. KBW10]